MGYRTALFIDFSDWERMAYQSQRHIGVLIFITHNRENNNDNTK